MIRVVVFLAAIALAPLVALAEAPAAKAPAKGVSDGYYARRQQAKSAAADAAALLTSESAGIERSVQVQEPNEPSLTAAMDVAVGPAARSETPTDDSGHAAASFFNSWTSGSPLLNCCANRINAGKCRNRRSADQSVAGPRAAGHSLANATAICCSPISRQTTNWQIW